MALVFVLLFLLLKKKKWNSEKKKMKWSTGTMVFNTDGNWARQTGKNTWYKKQTDTWYERQTDKEMHVTRETDRQTDRQTTRVIRETVWQTDRPIKVIQETGDTTNGQTNKNIIHIGLPALFFLPRKICFVLYVLKINEKADRILITITYVGMISCRINTIVYRSL
jgi:hypothetical protein